MDATLYNSKGTKAGTVAVPESIFGVRWNADLVHQVVESMRANARRPWAHTKDRGEVRGGGKKPWKQKGTGRARHGSRRSPIWKGGGAAHGPRNDKDYSRVIPRTMRAKALLTVLSKKFADHEVIFVDEFSFAAPKAAEAKKMIVAVAEAATGAKFKHNKAALIALPVRDSNTMKSFQNMGNIETKDVRDLNPVDVLSYKYLVIVTPEAAFQALNAKKILKKRAGTASDAAAPAEAPKKAPAKKKAPSKKTAK